MYETLKRQLGCTTAEINSLRKIVAEQHGGKVPSVFPLFPDAGDFDKRRAIYENLTGHKRIKNSVCQPAFEFARSQNTVSGLQSKYHYELDPDGVRKREIWGLRRDVIECYYDAIRSLENLKARGGESAERREFFCSTAVSALRVFEDALRVLTEKWNNGGYGESVKVSKPRRKKGSLQEAVELLRRHHVRITERTLSRWLKGVGTPEGFPGIEDTISLSQWATAYDRADRRKAVLLRGLSPEEIYQRKIK